MKFSHVISLGWFCSPALELERLGLKDTSSPFDWCLVDWDGVEKAIRTGFEGFLTYENLYQNKTDHNHYKDVAYGIEFFHDFTKYKPLDVQFDAVKQKYQRRIERFYANISEPTLFVRYIKDQPELDYLAANIDRVFKMLRQYNPRNDILFIANQTLTPPPTNLNVYWVPIDKDDTVSRMPVNANDELAEFLSQIELPSKEANLEFYRRKLPSIEKANQNITVKKVVRRLLYRDYIHCKQYE